MKWEAFADGIKNFFNTNFNTEMSEDDSPSEILDKINSVDLSANETVDNSAELEEIRNSIAALQDSMQELTANVLSVENAQVELKSEQNEALETMTEIDSRVTSLSEAVNKAKMSVSAPSKTQQETTKAAEVKETKKDENTIEFSLDDIMTGSIRN